MNGNLNFDASQVEPTKSFDPLPPGWYSMVIVKAELAESQTAGEMLKLELEIDERAHADLRHRKVFANLCLNHPNQQPREIARRTLSAIAHAIGVLQLSDTADLLGKTLLVKLRVQPAKDGYDARNEASGFRAIGCPDASAAPKAPGAPTAPSTPATPAAKPAWKK